MAADPPLPPQPKTAVTLVLDAGTGSCVVVGDGQAARALESRLSAQGVAVGRVASVQALEPGTAVIVLLASGDVAADRRSAEVLRARGVAARAVDEYGLGETFTRDGLELTVAATGGEAIREDLWQRLQAALPPNYARLQAWVSRHQATVVRAIPEQGQRQSFWRGLLQGWVGEAVMAGDEPSADQALEAQLRTQAAPSTGCVYLVGAGPGDPDLLTLRALRVLQMADVVLYDRLVAPRVLDLVPRGAKRVYVGKRRSQHAVPQETINQMLVRFAGEGARVVRLKGGDPFIFGRGGEEIDELMERGIRFEVVPGITAASGCAAYAGIPLTHRDHAQSCVFTTGHRRGDGSLEIDFQGLVRPAQTIVFYMGLAGLDMLVEGLIAHGMDPRMPAALVQQGTTTNQRVVAGALENLPQLAENARMRAPTLVIIGEVVRLRERLDWFRPRGGEGAFWAD